MLKDSPALFCAEARAESIRFGEAREQRILELQISIRNSTYRIGTEELADALFSAMLKSR